jgi:formylglycine-generating enzyme required for sulfatase activity
MMKALIVIAGVLLVSLITEAQTGRSAGDLKTNGKDGQQYAWIPAGQFTMGCSPDDEECGDEEKPAHAVTISSGFWMAQTTTTVGAYQRFSRDTGAALPPSRDSRGRKQNAEAEDENIPVVGVTWDEAKSFCEWAGMRLPTEAEWEYAARAGTQGARYDNLDDIAWYGDNSGNKRIDSAAVWRDPQSASDVIFQNGNVAKPVRQKRPNGWGLYDMLGNVAQWTADLYKPYGPSGTANSSATAGKEQRVTRGSPFTQPARLARVSRRGRLGPSVRNSVTGFRCAGD